MGMGRRAPPPPPQNTTAPTVVTESKDYAETQAGKNAAAQARVEDNQSATLLQTKDEEELKRQGMGGIG